MNTKRLGYFIALAEELNFSKVSSRLFISQQSLSKYISCLEQELEVKLFERRPKVALTEAGRRFLEAAQSILAIEEEFLRSRGASGTKLIVGVSGRMHDIMFYQNIMTEFRLENPTVSLNVVFGRMNTLDAMLTHGEIDLRVGYPNQETNRVTFAYHTIIYETLCIVIPKALAQERALRPAAGEPISIADFADMPFVMYPRNLGYRKVIDTYAAHRKLHLQTVFETDSSDALLRMAVQGTGITFISSGALNAYRRFYPEMLDSIDVYPIAELDYMRPLMIISLKGRPLTPAAASFVEICERFYCDEK